MVDNENERVLFGMDAEIDMKMKAKFDTDTESIALRWIEELTGERIGQNVHASLKNGVILCKLLNRIRPGTVRKFNENPNHVLVERENIQAYLGGCVGLGVPSQDLFNLSDLHEAKLMPQVIQNIYAVGRQAQVTAGFDGPRLGVRYSVTPEIMEKRRQAKEEQAMREYKVAKERESMQISRRDQLESEKMEDAKKKRESERSRAKSRRLTRGDMDFKRLEEEDSIKFSRLSISPVRYGMDLESHLKMQAKYDHDAEELAMDWIELVTGEPVDFFHKSLKNGILLCKVINSLRPGMIQKINMKPIALLERENIQHYLNSCVRIGVSQGELFTVSDLYEKKDLGAVVQNIHALGRVAAYIKSYQGPQFGERVLPNTGKKMSRRSTNNIQPIKPNEKTNLLANNNNNNAQQKKEEEPQPCCSACTIC